MDIVANYPIKRYSDGKFLDRLDSVLKEFTLSVYLDDILTVKLLCIPEYLEELVWGYLCSEGLIFSSNDVDNISISEVKDVANVDAHVYLKSIDNRADSDTKQLLTTDSGDFVSVPYKFIRPDERTRRLESIPWEPEVILKKANHLLEKSDTFKTTGNVHSVMICRDEEMLYFCEDIGRYNAFDKCVGRALKDHVDLSKTCVYTSGRTPSSIAMKAVRAGIPVIVSRSAPTDTTLEIANKFNLTVVGFARGDKFNLYT